VSFQIKVHGADAATAEMAAAIRLGLQHGLEKLAEKGAALVQQYSPVASGILANSITTGYEYTKTSLTALIFAGPPADVYAAPVEFGTRPHFPPPSELLPWVKLKFQPKDEKEALSIAFAIAKNISKRGTQGAEMFAKALLQIEEMARPVTEAELANALVAAGFGGQHGV
jgi:hypothetical protein